MLGSSSEPVKSAGSGASNRQALRTSNALRSYGVRNVALFTFSPSARLNPIEISIKTRKKLLG
jgi:hypothetical protein